MKLFLYGMDFHFYFLLNSVDSLNQIFLIVLP